MGLCLGWHTCKGTCVCAYKGTILWTLWIYFYVWIPRQRVCTGSGRNCIGQSTETISCILLPCHPNTITTTKNNNNTNLHFNGQITWKEENKNTGVTVSNLSTTAILETQKLWSLVLGGSCSEVIYVIKVKMGPQNSDL